MESHKCEKSETIENLQKETERTYKILHGNGQPGLLQSISELSGHIKYLSESVPELEKTISELVIFKNSEVAIKANRWKTIEVWGLYIGIIASVLISVINSKKEVPVEQFKNAVRAELKSYNITDDDIILRGRVIKPKNSNTENTKKEANLPVK